MSVTKYYLLNTLLLCGLTLSACAAEEESPVNDDPSLDTDAGDDPFFTASPDASVDDPSDDLNDTADCDPNADDPLDADGFDDNCDGSDGIAANQLYVAPAPAGSNSNNGSLNAPFASIAGALESLGGASGGNIDAILVAAGSYVEKDMLQLPKDLKNRKLILVGGYLPQADWSRGTDRSVLSGANRVILLNQLSGTSRIEGFDIHAASATKTSDSSIAVMAEGKGALQIVNSTIKAGKGQVGTAGKNGKNGNNGVAGKPGWAQENKDTGATPSVRSSCGTVFSLLTRSGYGGYNNGNGGNSTLGAAGGKASGNYADRLGASGRIGSNGKDGAAGLKLGTFSESKYAPALAGSGSNGTIGAGGGGGAAAYKVVSPIKRYYMSGGSGGSGGCEGFGGSGGYGGGASIGILASGITLDLQNSEVTSSNGGAGGDGGAKGVGGSGGVGAYGGQAYYVLGGKGGDGGRGGSGGAGGGGMGGSSFGIALRSGAKLQQSQSTITPNAGGKGGVGGSKGSNTGANGLSSAIYEIN
ncbi:MAG: hypothetical protein IPJ88_04475 [Myxococcales bacterium]|nr:MAG: hypothetical protein IPJ88_04475 [Myxococcales bacterium]